MWTFGLQVKKTSLILFFIVGLTWWIFFPVEQSLVRPGLLQLCGGGGSCILGRQQLWGEDQVSWQQHTFQHSSRGQPNPNNSAESEYIRNRIVPFLINRIGNKTIRIRFLISRIGICSIRIRFLINRIGICSIPYKPNMNRIFEMVKTIINHM